MNTLWGKNEGSLSSPEHRGPRVRTPRRSPTLRSQKICNNRLEGRWRLEPVVVLDAIVYVSEIGW
eukprot:15436818-Alexandrium_andersonii.AAC.1